MVAYQVLFFNHAGKVFSQKPFEADDDRDAVEYAEHVFSAAIGMGYEIRYDQHLVHREIFK